MIKKIELKNFMSHADSIIEPAEGLTVITGENNTGKSAIVYALQALCTNAAGDYMMRHGEKNCSIKIETAEGDVITWRRKKSVVSYNINGKDIHRLRGSVPDELNKILRISKVVAENESFDIHFGEQKEPIFILNKSAGKRASFFASSSDAIKLIEMQHLHKRKIQGAKWLEKKLLQDKVKYENRIESLTPIEAANEKIKKIEKKYVAINEAFLNIEQLKKYRKNLKIKINFCLKWQKINWILINLNNPPKLEDSQKFTLLIESIKKQKKEIIKNKKIASAIKKLSLPPVLEETSGLKKLIKKHIKFSFNIMKEKNCYKILGQVKNPPQLTSLADLKIFIERIEKSKKKYEKSKNNLQKSKKDLFAIKTRINKAVDEMENICPTCGQKITTWNFIHDNKCHEKI